MEYLPLVISTLSGFILLAIIVALIANREFRSDVLAQEGSASLGGTATVKGAVVLVLCAIFLFGMIFPLHGLGKSDHIGSPIKEIKDVDYAIVELIYTDSETIQGELETIHGHLERIMNIIRSVRRIVSNVGVAAFVSPKGDRTDRISKFITKTDRKGLDPSHVEALRACLGDRLLLEYLFNPSWPTLDSIEHCLRAKGYVFPS